MRGRGYALHMQPGPRLTDDETTVLVAELRDAGLLTIGTDAEGHETWTLTSEGAQVARRRAMSNEEDALELIGALLDAQG